MLEGIWKWIVQNGKLIMLFLKPPKEYEGLCRVRIVTFFAALAVSGFGVCGFLWFSSVEGRVCLVLLLLVAGIMSLSLIPIRILKRDTYRKVLDEKEEDGGIDENYMPNPDMAPEQVLLGAFVGRSHRSSVHRFVHNSSTRKIRDRCLSFVLSHFHVPSPDWHLLPF